MARADKQDLREELLQERRTLKQEDIDAARAAIRATVLEQCDAVGWHSVAAYSPLRTEPGSLELLDAFVRRGVRVLVPATLPDRDLDWVALPGDVPLGRDAISKVDAVLVPALAVARDGTRLGRGGGSYDRVLARVDPAILTVAAVYDAELLDSVPAEPHDRAVRTVVTPGRGVTRIG